MNLHHSLEDIIRAGHKALCWFSAISRKPAVTRARGHIFKNRCSLPDDVYFRYSEYEIVFLPTWLQRNHLEEKHSWRATDARQRLREHWGSSGRPRICFEASCSAPTLASIHYLRGGNLALSPGALRESDEAPRWLITSGQGQKPVVGKPRGRSSVAGIWLLNLPASDSNFQRDTSAKEFRWQEGLWWLCNQLGFNRPFAQTESESNSESH